MIKEKKNKKKTNDHILYERYIFHGQQHKKRSPYLNMQVLNKHYAKTVASTLRIMKRKFWNLHQQA